jgi:Secretion system C-terminal sorting domain
MRVENFQSVPTTDVCNTPDYLSVLEKMNTFNSESAIVELLIQEGQWNIAHARAQNIPNVVGLTKSTTREYEVYLHWVTFRNSLHLGGRDLSSMSLTEIQEVETIVQKFDTYAAASALEALNHLCEGSYFVPPAFGKQGQSRSTKKTQTLSDFFIQVFPNPSDFLVHFQFKHPLPTSKTCTLVVTDLLGKEVKRINLNPNLSEQIVNTSDLVNGMYLFNILIPELNHPIDGKFEVLH